MKEVLVVDDDPVFANLLQKRLQAEGYRAQGAASGDEALKRMAQLRPDLVIADVMMPGMDGFSFVREVRQQQAFWSVPIIIVTAHESLGDIFRVEGAAAVFYKPVNMDELLLKVRSIVG